MTEHRVPMLGSSWRRFEEPSRSRDPRVQAVVAGLAELTVPGPRPEFRNELRAQLVAIAPRIVADSAEGSTPMIDIVPARPRPRPTPHGARTGAAPTQRTKARHADSALDRLRAIPLRRPLTIVTAVFVAFAVLLGGAVMMSKKALPGDALYGLKRASERFELATASTDTGKARDYLNFATTRADEAKDLLSHASALGAGPGATAAGGVNAGTAQLITAALGSADADVKAASRLLGTSAVRSHSAAPLNTMISWAPSQWQRLTDLAAAMPDQALQARATSSAQLVRAALDRASALKPKLSCSCLSSSGSDQLGPVPCTVCTAPPASGQPTTPQPQQTSGSTPTGKTKHAAPGSTSGARVPPGNGAGPSSSAGSGGSGGSTPSGSASSPGGLLPSLLPTSASPPLSVGSCGVTVAVPILGGIGLGLCSGVNVSVGK